MKRSSLIMILMALFLFLGAPVMAGSKPSERQSGQVSAVPFNASSEARVPFFSRHGDERLMSWAEKHAQGGTLFFAKWDHEKRQFGPPVQGPKRDMMLVNWADYPRLQPGPKFWVWVWPEFISMKHQYAYGLRFARSFDQGRTWSESQWLHEDQAPVEHGFVSMATLADGRIAAIWLDGRAMPAQPKEGGGHEHHAEEHGDMQLRFRIIGKQTLSPEQLWDDRTCECCGTDLVRLENGDLVAAYRNRDKNEIRDIHFIRYRAGIAEKMTAAFNEQWNIQGCPVNGPALAAHGNRIATAWFSGKDDGTIGVAMSDNSGTSWHKIHTGEKNQSGRTDLLFTQDGLWASWVQETESGLRLWVRPFEGRAKQTQTHLLPHWDIPFPGGRGSGFPQIEILPDKTLLAAFVEPGKGIKILSLNK
ncbi:sialidase family protein [Acanthopleuribacter pedis]|uniref:Exo-alpha-sialidase n=1 Tax=Acanthopleuribacter pedis TaxID=442870 RepID=A0A8J7QHL7_9BACT|nr:sialidase family protein [Acanthopleuribacter pedis]MBO1320375.1 exo-alpha-sialidase [Acanthopleuribacter pedis]